MKKIELTDIISYAKEKYGVTITATPSKDVDIFKELFGGSFVSEEVMFIDYIYDYSMCTLISDFAEFNYPKQYSITRQYEIAA